jgi:hypothetical protein
MSAMIASFGGIVMPLASFALNTLNASTYVVNPHRGSAFPAARVIVLAVPIIMLTLIYLRVKGLKK